ncbi:TonB-dependent receptor [Robertkochia marina]|uniref:TonB-dependent receptor n=1 Tax=Robertkochia marina TaxID=1227945 RepID=A0A4S3LYY9_9FLAO|nr:TonB-dependent receptor [Robertkochia marina]THD66812.1 TonB-dependent receptor [Robertkochia marina]TRZ40879.1 TonB-dependent receptor [Robertkochia marina]
MMRNKLQLLKSMSSIWLKFSLLCFLMLSATAMYAQERIITGTVTDQSDVPLAGVTVMLENTSIGTSSDFDGNFTLRIPPEILDPVIVFSYVGFETQKTPVGVSSNLEIILEENATALEDVVVVGYGQQKKESLTASVGVISNEEIQTTVNPSVAQQLTGKIAGVQIRQLSGQPGSFANAINIRGFGEPIYVIDGIRRGGSADFQQLNPDDIESISILKDASAAIYGLGAANGVILVTTKKGNKEKASFTYTSLVGTIRPTDVPEMANAAQYTQMWNDTQLFIPGGAGVPYYSPEEIERWKEGGPGYESTNWNDLTIKDNAMTAQHNLTAAGGNDKTNYFLSFGYVTEDGLLKSDDMGYERYTFRSNITTELVKNVTGSLLIGGRWDRNWEPGTNFFNIFKGSRVSLPIEDPYANNNPEFLAPVSSGLNPVAFMERDVTGYNENQNRNLTTTFSLEYKAPFLEGLSFKGVGAYDLVNYQNKSVYPTYLLYNYDEATGEYIPIKQRDGTANINNTNRNGDGLTFQGYINYNNTFFNDHAVEAQFIVEKNSFSDRFSTIKRYYADFYTKDQLRFADAQNQESDGLESQSADLSYIGNLTYGYKGKYLLQVAARYMGSYRYSPDTRWGFYPSASAGWRISEESFIKDNIDWISNLKLRASYGIAGMPEGGPFQYVPGYSLGSGGSYEFVDGELTEGISTPPPPNNNLTWMEATTTNFGLDLGLFRSRLNFTIDVFQRDLEGMPARPSVALPNTYGGALAEENLNSEITQGLDLTLGYRSGLGQDFKYDITANFSYARTKRDYVEGEAFTNSMDRWRNQQGDRWNDIAWGYDYIGQFQNEQELINAPMQNGDRSNVLRELPGDFRYADWNNDGIIDGQDVQPLFFAGRPKMFYGLNLNASYKNFYINVLFQGAAKYTVRFREVYAEMFAFRGNTPAYFYDRWTKEDPYDINSEWVPGKWPASRTIGDVGAMYNESSVWRRDASYLRLKSIELGYDLTLESLERVLGITKIRFYLNGFNLYTWADDFVKPFDPEKIEGAYSAGFTYPLTQTFNFGFNINF